MVVGAAPRRRIVQRSTSSKKTVTPALSTAAAVALIGALVAPASANASEPVATPLSDHQLGDASTGGGVLLPTGGITPNYTSHPEGGTWIHGTDNGVYSNYHHPTKRHGSTAMNGRGLSHKVTNVGGGAWSRASIAKTWAGNSAYWHLS